MIARPFPLFDKLKRLGAIEPGSGNGQSHSAVDYLLELPCSHMALDSYNAVHDFLIHYSDNQATYNSFRTHSERILLWSLLIAKKPLFEITEIDVKDFVAFCLNPPDLWVGRSGQCRFLRMGGRKISDGDLYEVNPAWRPFNYTTPKRSWKLSNEQSRDPQHQTYEMSETSVQKMLTACSLLFKHFIESGLVGGDNPITSPLKHYRLSNNKISSQKFMSRTQWKYVLRAAEGINCESAQHETVLFIIATSLFVCIKVSDMAGWGNWQPRMGDFYMDGMSSWWFDAPCKTGKFTRVSVGDEYINYLKRYRVHLGMTPLPAKDDCTPLLTTITGGFDLSALNIRRVLHDVLSKAIGFMKSEECPTGKLETMQAASAHWLRGTLQIPNRSRDGMHPGAD